MANTPQLQLLETKDFNRHLKHLCRRGGIADAVYKEVVRALIDWNRGADPNLPRTHHGESRVPHVVKYDLKAYYRLVVYEHAGKRIPLMVGDHAEVDRWLDNNRGKDFTVNTRSNHIQYIPAGEDPETTAAATSQVNVPPTATGPVLVKLPQDLRDALGLPETTAKTLETFVTFENVEEEGVWHLIQSLMFPTEEHRQVVIQAIALLAAGNDEQARQRIELFNGNARTASQSPEAFAEAIDSGQNSDEFLDLSRLSDDEIERLVGAKGLTDWMLYLHPDQKKYLEREYAGPARVIGVSGSGKTSLLVHRANHLAKKYAEERILVLSLNAALCQLIQAMLGALCSTKVRRRIDVMTVYEYCYQAVKQLDPGRLIERRDPRSGEDLKACWEDFMKKPHARKTAGPVLDALDCRPDFIDSRTYSRNYVLEELIWIRGGFGREERDRYLTCERHGRGVAMPAYNPATSKKPQRETGGAMPWDARPRLLKLLADYEEWMAVGGLADHDGVSLEAYSLRGRIKERPDLRARCALVDEVQDCSTVELAVIAEIPTALQDGLYLTGDPVQKVFPKPHDLTQAGISIVGRAAILRKNYRNTQEILEAAFLIIREFYSMSPVPINEVLEPEYAFRHGSRPVLYECSSRSEQVRLVMWYLSLLPAEEHDSTCIASPTEMALQEVKKACQAKGLAVFRISGEAARTGVIGRGIKLSLLPELKGYEFRQVYLLDLMDMQLLPKGMPWEERWRVAFQLYVAMTRARDDLVMSFVLNRSILLRPLWDSVKEARAAELLGAPHEQPAISDVGNCN